MERFTDSVLFSAIRPYVPSLIPFCKAFALYFFLFRSDPPSITYCVFKCAPICCLIFFVHYQALDSPDNKNPKNEERRRYSKGILFGLVFSCLGDALLVGRGLGLFVPGMLAFMVAHVAYVTAFEFRPLALPLLPPFLLYFLLINLLLASRISGLLSVVVPIYSLAIGIMLWRALAKSLAEEGGLHSFQSLSRLVGAVLFGVSDTLLAVEEFVCPLPLSEYSIMLTYYFAQLGLALSTITIQPAKQRIGD
ncbi:Lysoplasmalogenase-like protein tmem86a [Sparganum proliferum]